MPNATFIDITAPITASMPVWPGDPQLLCETPMHLAQDDDATVSRWTMSAHVGTHVDAPAHFISGGQKLQELPLEGWCGPCHVVEIAHPSEITVAELSEKWPKQCKKVLFKTQNSASPWFKEPFNKNFVHIPPETAAWLVAQGITLVGVDYLSVESFHSTGAPTHHCLLGAQVRIVEGLYLAGINPGPYHLTCLPMHLAEAGDGAPARVVLSMN